MIERTSQIENLGGPVRSVLLGAVARRYYLHGMSKVDIAQDLGISRFKVARLLDEAMTSGLVTIRIGNDGDLDVEASVRLAEKYRLRRALVLRESGGGSRDVRTQLGHLAARWLVEELEDGDVLGLPWSRAIYTMVKSIDRLPAVDVVQLCGALATDPEDSEGSAVETVVEAARTARGRGLVFFAPLIVEDAITARALRRQAEVCAAAEAVARVTTAVVGIGSWGPRTSTVYDACTPEERIAVAEAGVVGEMAGVFFDEDGHVQEPVLSQRLVTLAGGVFTGAADVTALAHGAEKVRAVRATVKHGLVHGLIVDAGLATALLAD